MSNPYHNRFKDMMNDVVAAGSCCECASCVLVCPHNVIEMNEGKPRVVSDKSPSFDYCGISEGVGCDVCAAVCPRLWPREPHLRDLVFEDDEGYEDIFGVYRHIFVARTKDAAILDRAQDGGIVTALLAWARERDEIDGAVVSAVGPEDEPCFPSPKLATSADEIKAASGSWYTYCPNNAALAEAEEKGCEKVAFVGVPCQITPIRKMLATDPSILAAPGKKAKIVTRQRKSMVGPAERVAFTVGLFCTEVFRPELMTERIERQMGIPLSDVAKFNVKGEVLIYRKNGDVATIPLAEAMADYQRPACQHCGDFSAEMADIACGGVGTDRTSIVVLRTRKGVDIWRRFEASGGVEVFPIQESKKSWNILQRLARRQHERIPAVASRSGTLPGLPAYDPCDEAALAEATAKAANADPAEFSESLDAAYSGRPRPKPQTPFKRQPIPNDPGVPAPGEKRALPPPPSPEQGGASPLYVGK